MGKTTIEWTATYHADGTITPGYTFNPWWGCVKVSPGCISCYAETLANRYGHAVWGPAKTTPRRPMSENYWKQPLRWNKAAEQGGQRARVFCASMADVFEDHPQVVDWRMRLFNLIDSTPRLDWLLLTKRPENIMPMMVDWLEGTAFPPNIWIGTSVEDQRRADERIPHLLRVPARVRFLSCEPLLGPVDVEPYMCICSACMRGERCGSGIHWCITGAESGRGARPCDRDWVRALRDQCTSADVAFFYKQDAVQGKKIPTPELDGVKWMQFPQTTASPGPRGAGAASLVRWPASGERRRM